MRRMGEDWGTAAPGPKLRPRREGGRRRPPRRGRRKGWLAATLLVGAVLVAAGGAWWARRPVPQPEPAPSFSLVESGGRQVSLADFRGRPVALVFFRTFWSSACQQQLVELQRAYPQIKAGGAELVAIAVAPVEEIGSGKDEFKLAYPVLTDPAHAAAESYGVYDLLGDGLAAPSVFVIDRAGYIRWRYVGKGIADRPPADRVLQELRRAAR